MRQANANSIPTMTMEVPKEIAIHNLKGCQVSEDARLTYRLFMFMVENPRPVYPEEVAAHLNIPKLKVLRFLKSGLQEGCFVALSDGKYMVSGHYCPNF